MVDTVDQVIDVGGKVAEQSAGVLKALGEAVKPALPVLKSAGDEAIKLAAPVVSGASKQATEALQGAGVDPAPVVSAAKVRLLSVALCRVISLLVTTAEYCSIWFDDIALLSRPRRSRARRSSTPRSPSRRRPWRPSRRWLQGTTSWPPVRRSSRTSSCRRSGLLSLPASAVTKVCIACFLHHCNTSALFYSLDFAAALCRQGDLTAAQALDKVTSQDYVLIDVRNEKDKAKAGVPQLPSNAKNRLISVPYAFLPSAQVLLPAVPNV